MRTSSLFLAELGTTYPAARFSSLDKLSSEIFALLTRRATDGSRDSSRKHIRSTFLSIDWRLDDVLLFTDADMKVRVFPRIQVVGRKSVLFPRS